MSERTAPPPESIEDTQESSAATSDQEQVSARERVGGWLKGGVERYGPDAAFFASAIAAHELFTDENGFNYANEVLSMLGTYAFAAWVMGLAKYKGSEKDIERSKGAELHEIVIQRTIFAAAHGLRYFGEACLGAYLAHVNALDHINQENFDHISQAIEQSIKDIRDALTKDVPPVEAPTGTETEGTVEVVKEIEEMSRLEQIQVNLVKEISLTLAELYVDPQAKSKEIATLVATGAVGLASVPFAIWIAIKGWQPVKQGFGLIGNAIGASHRYFQNRRFKWPDLRIIEKKPDIVQAQQQADPKEYY